MGLEQDQAEREDIKAHITSDLWGDYVLDAPLPGRENGPPADSVSIDL